jgi:predicted RNA binding protein YcfA (HicA-like mRNA interferase family)
MTPRRLLVRLSRGQVRNVRFSDLVRLLQALGFVLDRTRGSHHVFVHRELGEILVLQPDRNGQAKPYQIRQLLRLVERYALGTEVEDG